MSFAFIYFYVHVMLCYDVVFSFRTKNRDTCLSWNTHAYDHNHCRNPTRKIEPKEAVWCYTGMGNTWDYCDVPWCLTDGQESMNTTEVEKEGIPVINTATIILGTVALFLGIVIFLILGFWFCNNGEEKKDVTIELVPTLDSGVYSS